MKKYVSYFLQGLLYLVPLVVTVYVLVWTVSFADGLVHDILEKLGIDNYFYIPGIGLLLVIVIISAVGYVGPTLIKTPTAQLLHKLINSAPFVRVIYSSLKDLMSAVVGKNRKFGMPVLVNLDDSGTMHRLGFVTQEDLSALDIDDTMIAVMLPNSYGMLGDLVIVPRSKVRPVKAHSADVMKFIVSGGVTQLGEEEEIKE